MNRKKKRKNASGFFLLLGESVTICERTGCSGFTISVWVVSRFVSEEPSAAAGTTLRKMVIDVGRTRSVDVKCFSLRWEDVQRCDSTALDNVHAVHVMGKWVAKRFCRREMVFASSFDIFHRT